MYYQSKFREEWHRLTLFLLRDILSSVYMFAIINAKHHIKTILIIFQYYLIQHYARVYIVMMVEFPLQITFYSVYFGVKLLFLQNGFSYMLFFIQRIFTSKYFSVIVYFLDFFAFRFFSLPTVHFKVSLKYNFL